MTTEEIMEQAQLFASSWSLVGSRFDLGDEIINATKQELCLKQMVEAQQAEITRLQYEVDAIPAIKAERDALMAFNAAITALKKVGVK